MSFLRSILSYSTTIAAVLVVSAGVTSASAKPDKNASAKGGKGNQQLTEQQRAEKAHRKQLKKAGWKVLWEDNFSEGNLDGDNWGHEVNCTGGGNNEQQCYTDRPDNSFVDDGVLHIVAKEEAFSGPALGDDDPNYDPNDTSVTLPYTSARLRSKNKFDFTYGRVEVRAKVPGGQGMWPAIWMLPTDWVYGGWPSSGEIDIMEAVNLGVWPDEVHGTNHYGLSWPQWENHGQTFEMDENPADDYHVYAIEWEADEIRWYVDGKHYQTQTSEGWYNYVWQGQEEGFQVANPRAPFDQDFHLILNVAAGGDWPGTPDTGWPEDREMLVDYVHVYQCDKPKSKSKKGKKNKSNKNDKSDKSGKSGKSGKSNKDEEIYTGAGCGTIDETVEVNTDVGAPGVNSYSMYADGPETLSFDVGGDIIDNTLVAGFWELVEGTVFQQEVNLGGDHGQVWDIMFNGIGNVFLGSADMSDEEALDDGFQLAGGSGWTNFGELEFDIFVSDASADSQLVVKLDSGWPNVGQVIIDMPPTGEWHHVAVKVADLLANPIPEGGGVDLSKVLNVFVLEHLGGYASVQVDNIQLQCAVNTEPEDWQLDKTCSIEPRVATVAPIGDVLDVYIDAVTDWELFDCCGGASIAELDLGGNNVLEFTYDADPGTNTVTFFQPPAPVDLSGYAGGTVEFDMFVVSQPTNPAANPWLIKVDCDSGCSTGDTPITQSVEGVLPATGVWQHYTFNLDDLVGQGLDLGKVSAMVIFPAWGNQDNAVFQLDNVVFVKSDGGGSGGGTGGGLSDFEGDPGSYAFSDFAGGVASIVDNPDASGINTSAQVGQMLKYAGDPWGGSTLSLEGPVDFPAGTVVTMKVWSLRPVPVLFKLEGMNVERSVNHSGTGWEELSFDFTGDAGTGVTDVTLIFDLGVVGDAAGDPANWTFYFDDITLPGGGNGGGSGGGTGGGTAGAIDFEPGGLGDFWSWSVFENADNPPLEFVPNPDTSGGNASATVAQFTARQAGAPWAGTETFDKETFTLDASNSLVKIWVYKSVISDVGIKFAIANGGAQPEIKVANTLVNQWEELTFDFSDRIGLLESIDITTLIIFPDFDLAGRTTDTVNYFDNITFNAADGGTGGGGGGTASYSNDFEGAPESYPFTDFDGGVAEVISNPVAAGINTSAQVGQMLKYAGQPWGGSTLTLEGPVNIAAGSVFTMKVWSQRAVPVLFKLEGMNVERSVNHSGSGWEELSFDFTGDTGAGVTDITLIFDLGTMGDAASDPSNWTFYFDDIALTNGDGGGGGTGGGSLSTLDFEAAGSGNSGFTWSVFENADNPPLVVVANPFPGGINGSAEVAQFTARLAGNPWAGTETAHGDIGPFTLDATNSTVKIMVYKTVVSDVGIKFAIANGGAQPEIKVANTLVNEWEELTFDFSGYIGTFESIDIDQVIVFPDFQTRSGENTVYFDNISFGQ